ncbi:MAG TPA: hypothetical protein VFV19_07100 [Candidatus Polarisedimenticolaceae bacterium]|nr:hypothetical protein [Candidatus Polarisedimenticolaceae bacterium]
MKRDDVRRAFRWAEGDEIPRVDPLVDAVPSLIARARSAPAAPVSYWPAVPRLATITALAVVVAVALTLTSRSETSSTFERVMMGGSASTGDLLLDAVLGVGRNDG